MVRSVWLRVVCAAVGAAGLALPALAQGSVFEWNLGTLAAGKVYPSTITAQNRCSKKQTLASPWGTWRSSSEGPSGARRRAAHGFVRRTTAIILPTSFVDSVPASSITWA